MSSRSGKKSKRQSTPKPRRHCNHLDGKRWLQNSISIWGDIRKSTDEVRLNHPAMFPAMLVERLIDTFLAPEGNVVLDPFSGSGSTVLAARRMGKQGIGLELSGEYVALAKQRLAEFDQSAGKASRSSGNQKSVVYEASAADLLSYVKPESVDLCISSPPYWNILNQRRTADLKSIRHYGNLDGDLGVIDDYEEFLTAVAGIFRNVLTALKPGSYCCVIVMDLRKKNFFFPLHSDLASRLVDVGYLYDDLIIWNRQSEYNNLRPLGYPAVFRVNKVHEFVLLMQKVRG